MQKLKPCPFKGCQVSIEIERPGWPHPDVNLYVIEDRVCGFRFVNYDRGKLEETWNARAGETQLWGFLEKLWQAVDTYLWCLSLRTRTTPKAALEELKAEHERIADEFGPAQIPVIKEAARASHPG
jgi:hypothetical protein